MRLDTPAIYFHFPRPARPTFHMDGVAGPLVIAGIDPGCRILSVATMASGETGHRLPGPVCAALEIGAGHPVIARLAPGSSWHRRARRPPPLTARVPGSGRCLAATG